MIKIHLPARRKSGVALIMVMIAIAVFTLLAAAFAFSMKVETKLAQNADNEQQLLWLGRSGVELARWVLAEEAATTRYDALNQIWAGGPGGGAETNSPLTGIPLDNYTIGDGTVSIKIVDLERKANINTATTPVLQLALTTMGVDANDLSVVSDSILDWIDADDSPHVAGAESDYYQSLTPPYYSKNAPIDDLSELLLIKGVTPEMYDLTNSPVAQQPKRQKLGFGNSPGEVPVYAFGLKDVFTPFSNGKININTAGTNVLMLIQGVDAAAADAIVKYRAGPDGAEGTEDDQPVAGSNFGQLTTAGIGPQIIQRIQQACTTRSSTFEVHVTAHVLDSTREYTAILFRNSGTDIRVLSFYWK